MVNKTLKRPYSWRLISEVLDMRVWEVDLRAIWGLVWEVDLRVILSSFWDPFWTLF